MEGRQGPRAAEERGQPVPGRPAVTARAATILIAALLSGCATSGPFQGYLAAPDPFQPGVEHRFADPISAGRGIAIGLSHRWRGDAPGTWTLKTSRAGSDWLFVEGVRLLVDGSPWGATEVGTPRREVQSGYSVSVLEVNTFEMSQQLVDALAAAKSVTVRLHGQHFYEQGDVSSRDVVNMAWFIGWVREQTQPQAGPSLQ